MTFLLHIFDIVSGIAASLTMAGFVFLLGMLVLSRAQAVEAQASHVTVIGAAIAVLWLWYAFRLGINLTIAIRSLVALACLAAIVKRRTILFVARATVTNAGHSLSTFVQLFALFYALSYLLLMPPVSAFYLPLVRIANGNNDILNYFIAADYLQRLGPSNVANYSYVGTLTFTPATFDVLFALATLFGGETIRATMPAMFGLVALIGCTTARLVQICFGLALGPAAAIAALVISGPFFSYVTGHYFLSTFAAELLLLLMIVQTVIFTRTPKPLRSLVLAFAPYHFLLFFAYPPLYVLGVGVQFALAMLYNLFSRAVEPTISLRDALSDFSRSARSWTVMPVVLLAVIWAIDPSHAREIFDVLVHISSTGVAGWPQGLISPLALLGWPVSSQVLHPVTIIATTVLTLVILVGIVVLFFRGPWRNVPSAGAALLVVSVLTFLLYLCYYARVGASYQQWKIASYLPMFFAFPLLAAACQLWRDSNLSVFRRVHVGFPAICALLVVVNIATNALRKSPLETFPAKYANLAALDELAEIKDIYIRMSSYSAMFFPVYYIKHKTLHLLEDSYFPKEKLDPNAIGPTSPLFVEGPPCASIDAGLSIKDVGCLYTRPQR